MLITSKFRAHDRDFCLWSFKVGIDDELFGQGSWQERLYKRWAKGQRDVIQEYVERVKF